MSSSDKKGGKSDKKAAESTVEGASRSGNLFGRHGNDQLKDVTSSALASQGAQQATVLAAAMASESEVESSADQSWWQDEEVVRSADKEEEGSAALLATNRTDAESDRQQADKDSERGRRLAPQEELALLADKKAAMSAGALAEHEKSILKDADAAGASEEEKAAMLVKSGSVSEEVLHAQTGAVQAFVAADQMPEMLAGLNRDAAGDVSKTPLNERDTIRNVTEEIRLIGKQIQTHPRLASPSLSIEEKATAMVDILAYQLDVPTRESVAAHPFLGLHEDLIFDPQSIMAINTIAGSSREVRTLGSFAIVAWQLAVNTVKDELNTKDDNTAIDESKLWKTCLSDLAGQMYIDALMKPSATA